MKMMKRVVGLTLLMALLAFPASAFASSYSNHSSDQNKGFFASILSFFGGSSTNNDYNTYTYGSNYGYGGSYGGGYGGSYGGGGYGGGGHGGGGHDDHDDKDDFWDWWDKDWWDDYCWWDDHKDDSWKLWEKYWCY